LLLIHSKYLTSSSTNWNLAFEIPNPWQLKKIRRLVVVSVTSFSVNPDYRRSSTYCNKLNCEEMVNSSRTCSKTWPNGLRETVKPCGWTFHLYYCFIPVWGFFHSKAKMSMLSSTRRHAQNASFKF
jgi:hypothetical protein